LPTFIILLVIAFYPLGSVFYNSLTNKVFASDQPVEFVGLENYSRLLSMTIRRLPPVLDASGNPEVNPETGEPVYARSLDVLPREPRRYREAMQFSFLGNRYVVGATDRDFVRGIFDTLRFTVFSVVLETVLGLGIAMVVNTKFTGRGAMRAVMLVPWAIPTAVSSRMWQWMFQSTRVGFFNVVFQGLGLIESPIPFLTEQTWQVPAMIAIDVWKTTPFMALLLLAGLQLIPGDIYEAADVDGASKLRQFFTITLPLLRPTLAVALVFRTLDALRVFDLFQIVLAQSRYSMASFTYYQLTNNRAMGYSSASSVIIFILIFVFAVVYIQLLGGVDAE
ncbi:MAG TPA: sugar ABC transporter permease, partial [Chloroflexi bacterium]|nr:sugar ABC transporter permease [Chloroflexota bacterium]